MVTVVVYAQKSGGKSLKELVAEEKARKEAERAAKEAEKESKVESRKTAAEPLKDGSEQSP